MNLSWFWSPFWSEIHLRFTWSVHRNVEPDAIYAYAAGRDPYARGTVGGKSEIKLEIACPSVTSRATYFFSRLFAPHIGSPGPGCGKLLSKFCRACERGSYIPTLHVQCALFSRAIFSIYVKMICSRARPKRPGVFLALVKSITGSTGGVNYCNIYIYIYIYSQSIYPNSPALFGGWSETTIRIQTCESNSEAGFELHPVDVFDYSFDFWLPAEGFHFHFPSSHGRVEPIPSGTTKGRHHRKLTPWAALQAVRQPTWPRCRRVWRRLSHPMRSSWRRTRRCRRCQRCGLLIKLVDQPLEITIDPWIKKDRHTTQLEIRQLRNPHEAPNIEVGESFLGGPQQMEVKNLKPCCDYRICRGSYYLVYSRLLQSINIHKLEIPINQSLLRLVGPK